MLANTETYEIENNEELTLSSYHNAEPAVLDENKNEQILKVSEGVTHYCVLGYN